MNRHIGTVIVAPMSTRGRPYPSRVHVAFQGRQGQVVLDQIRTVDKSRLEQHLGSIDEAAAEHVLATLSELFAP
jgi:mRNA interferase MazF